jgi:hypothetical protein
MTVLGAQNVLSYIMEYFKSFWDFMQKYTLKFVYGIMCECSIGDG